VKRLHALLLVAVVIGGVAGARVLLRDDAAGPGPAPLQEQPAEATGRTVPLEIAPLPPTLKKEGDFACAELRNQDGSFTGRAQGGSIRNVSGGSLTYAFTFEVSAGEQTENVQSRFRLNDGQGIPSVTMVSKSVAGPVTKCTLRIVAAEVTAQDIAKVDAAAEAAGCGRVMRHESDGHDHIEPPQRGSYSTSPPTSGNHYSAPSRTGVHDEPVPDEVQVHNLEHGHVGLHYKGVSNAGRAALEDAARGDTTWIFAAPYPAMDAAVAMTAWTVSLHCATEPKDPAALAGLAELFVSAFRDQGRESIPGMPA